MSCLKINNINKNIMNSYNNIIYRTQSQYNKLPEFIIEKIFSNLQGKDLNNCTLVCKKWYEVLQNEAFWRKKCVRDRRLTSQHITLFQKYELYESKRLYYSNMFNKNLLKNPCGNENFDHWFNPGFLNFTNVNVDRLKNIIVNHKKTPYRAPEPRDFRVETDNHGVEAFYDKNNNKIRNFATSFCFGGKMQIIELKTEYKLVEKLINKGMSVFLEISDNYIGKFGWGSFYSLHVFLFTDNFEMVDSYSINNEYLHASESNWQRAYHHFNLKKPIRYVMFFHGGQAAWTNLDYDPQLWSQFYGAKMTNACVRFFV